MPLGACSLWPDSESMSIAVDLRSIGILPTAWTASVWNSAPTAFALSASSATGKDRAGLVVRPHDGDDCHAIRQRRLVGIQVEPPFCIDRDHMDADAFVLLQPRAQRQHRRVLDRTGDDLAPARVGLERGQDRGVVAFGAAGGEHDLMVVLGTEQALQLAARAVHRRADVGAEGMHRGWIAELLGKERQHRLDDARIDPGGGIVVEIDGFHRDFRLCTILAASSHRYDAKRQAELLHQPLLHAGDRHRRHLATDASARQLDHDGIAVDIDELAIAAVLPQIRPQLLDCALDQLDLLQQWSICRRRPPRSSA